MPLKNLTNSTVMQDDFLDGAYMTDYMNLWNQKLQHKTETAGVREYIVDWVRSGTGAQVSMSTRFLNVPEYSDILRSTCHQAIEILPDEGLNELCTSLGEMLEFYNEEKSINNEKVLPNLTTQPALKGSTYERIPFHIEED